MPRTSPLHNAIWAAQLAAELKAEGLPAERLLAEAGIERGALAAKDARLPFDRIATFFELAAEARGDDCLGLRFGQTREVRDAGLIAFVGLSSATVRDTLRNLARYHRVFSDAVMIDVGDLDRTGRLSWDFHTPPALRRRQFIEFSYTNLMRGVRQMTRRAVVPTAVTFSHARNENVDAFRRFFGCDVGFAAPENAIRFALPQLRFPVHSADDRLLAVLEEHCRIVLERHAVAPPSLVEQVERLVVDRLAAGEARLGPVARALGLSTRSLSRRLAEDGTTFQAIVETVRRELAVSYLSESALSITEIAFVLGYAEVSSFNHAFRRWTGQTPLAVRRDGLAQAE